MLVKKYQSNVLSIAYAITSNMEDARDIAQESFIKAYKKLDGFSQESSFKNWILSITYNTGIDLLRKRKTILNFIKKSKKEDMDPQYEKYNTVEGSEIFSPALKKLKPRERAALLLQIDLNYKTKEIGKILNCNESTVRVHIFNAKKKLKKILSVTERSIK